jgi:hypothetical protein
MFSDGWIKTVEMGRSSPAAAWHWQKMADEDKNLFVALSGQSQGIWSHREAFRKSLAVHRSSGPSLYEGSSVDWPFNIRVAIGRELINIIMNELRVNLSADGGLIVAGQVVNINGDAVNTFPAPANRASCPGQI